MKASNNFRNRLLKGLAWMGSKSAIQAILQILLFLILTNYLSPSDYGQFAQCMIFISFANIIANAGIAPIIISRLIIDDNFLAAIRLFSILIGIVSAGFVLTVGITFDTFFNNTDNFYYLITLSLVFPFLGCRTVSFGLMQRALDFRAIAVINILSYFMFNWLITLLLALAGLGIWSLVIGFTLHSIITSVIFSIIDKNRFEVAYNKHELIEIVKYTKWYLPSLFANNLSTQIDNIVVTVVYPASALGLYSRGYQFLLAPASTIGSLLDKVIFPNLVQDTTNGEKFTNYSICFSVTILCGTLLGLVLAPFWEVIFIQLLNKEWLKIIDLVSVFCFVIGFRAAQKITGSYLKSTGNIKQLFRFQIITIISHAGFASFGALFSIQKVAAFLSLSIIFVNIGLYIYLLVESGEFSKLTKNNAYHFLFLITALLISVVGIFYFA